MVNSTGLIRLTAVAATLAAAGVASASIVAGTATLTETATAPAAASGGTVVASNLPTSSADYSNSNSSYLNYYAGRQASPEPGETFTTGNTATSITDVIVQIEGGTSGNAPLYLYLGTASGGNAFTGTTYEYTATNSSAKFANGDYLDFTLNTPFAASANTLYVYAVSTQTYSQAGETNAPYLGLGVATGGGSAGTSSEQLATIQFDTTASMPNAGAAYSTYTTGAGKYPIATGTTGNANAVFEVLGTTTSAVPLPSTLALTLSGMLGLGLLLKQRKAT